MFPTLKRTSTHLLRSATAIAAVACGALYCQARPMTEAPDTTIYIGEVEVTAATPPQGMRLRPLQGMVTITGEGLLHGLRVGGEADAIRSLTMLPGVAAGSDYGSGLSVEGADFSHTSYSIDGAPVLFPFHFGGVMSTFITSHLQSATLYKHRPPATAPARLAGHLAVESLDQRPERPGGMINVGMLATSLTLKSPAGRRGMVAASVRRSYLGLLLGPLMTVDSQHTDYDLTDMNLTGAWQLGGNDHLKVSAFANFDDLSFGAPNQPSDLMLRWHNAAASARWTHTCGHGTLTATAYATDLGSRLSMAMSQMDMTMKSRTGMAGVNALWQAEAGWHAGVECEAGLFAPQHITAEGYSEQSAAEGEKFTTYTLRGWGGWRGRLPEGFTLEASLGAGMYACSGAVYPIVAPSLTVERRLGPGNLAVTLAGSTQVLHQVGFSDIGLASNFWFPSTADVKPQHAWGVTAGYSAVLAEGAVMPSLAAFWRRIVDQSEYTGALTAVLEPDYSAAASIEQASGYNTGLDAGLRVTAGTVSVTGGYALAICRRRYPEAPDRWLPSANEPRHSGKLLAEWKPLRALTVTGLMVVASGRRYTPVKALYYLGGNLLQVYGARNSGSFPLYHRLDLSATWQFGEFRVGGIKVSSMLNLSLANVYGRNNVELQYYTVDTDRGSYRQIRRGTLFRFLPSLSYTLSF